MLTITGLILNIIGTILIAKYGRAVKHYSSDGAEILEVQTGKSEGLFKYTENIMLSTIGWTILIIGFVLQLLQTLIAI